MVKISVIIGTRPEIIKMAPIIEKLERGNYEYFILHSGQHYSYEMDRIFFKRLKLPQPKYNLNVGSGSHAEETARILVRAEKIFKIEKPDIVLVQGDTNTTLAGALAAVKLLIKVGHVEAGLRSFNREMPEEINRILTDHLSDYLFAPTNKAKENLLNEGIDEHKIHVTGNTIVDAVYRNINIALKMGNILDKLNLKKNNYFLVTIHRQENVDRRDRFSGILEGLKMVSKEYHLPIIYPIHPRAKKRINEFRLKLEGIILIDPLDYLDFLNLEANARLILTDSGGVQEEACILRVPCVTLRYDTERPETIDVGANILAGTKPESILEKTRVMLERPRTWDNPFGDGKASERILKVINENLKG